MTSKTSEVPDGASLMGWCMTNTEDHKNCRKKYTDWVGTERVCSCQCHTKGKP